MTDAVPIIRIAARGEGITEDGRHSPLSAPGDLLHVDGSLTHGPHHVDPACRHFPKCGGCQLQHVDDASYADFLGQRIAGALMQQKITAPDMAPAILSAPQTRRRVSLRAERQGKRMLLGFNEEQSHHIVDLKMCAIMHPALFALVDPLRKLLHPMLRDRRAAGVQMTLVDQGVDLLIEKVEVEGLAAVEALNDFALRHKLARLSIDDGYGAQPRWEPEPATVTLGGVVVPFPAGGFLQATADGEGALVAAVEAIVGDAALVADLFAGLGTFALPLSKDRRVYAAEGARDAVLGLKAAADGAQRIVAVEHRDLFRRPLDVAEVDRFDALVLDPPRPGAKEQMAALAASTKLRRIAYVSCNPSTFARDARTLIEGGWTLQRITPVGQFRWSTHVELVASFVR
ncbi:class I SAM-dependent RNA methyltransferase [Rhizorhabdus dicambivorans]|uniref:Class I SAM-dependent RNA methyltransferase n=1 Tax=Rhizorhabdus dicambivorans TaxID=1850238 RepID=A0A2A4FW68_9SPHN|nr:class I SAM-dependent RNA methyltransferase [Rhizorhabdus dicambivorans]ATE65593.1 class I SAM-dependent RNA methyltransferase [Rhizorhabdus dicambivorans]PCE41936.1 class I SAM-dependent RNA methyltransferase [Rhizorhabdus dicambivorans]